MLESRLISILRNNTKALLQTSSSFFSKTHSGFSSSLSRVFNHSPFLKPSTFFHSKPTNVPSASSIPPRNPIIYNAFTSFLKYHKVWIAFFNYSHPHLESLSALALFFYLLCIYLYVVYWSTVSAVCLIVDVMHLAVISNLRSNVFSRIYLVLFLYLLWF